MLDVSEQGSRWRVMKIGRDRKADTGYIEQWRHMYEKFRAMPVKTQEAVAVLSMCADGETLPGVGEKVSSTSYWVVDTEEILKEYGDVL